MPSTSSHPLKRWILVAGTGKIELPPAVYWAALATGRELARKGYGLVVGGWSGVDYVAAQSFAAALQGKQRLSDCLIQVVPQGSQPQFQGGHVVYVPPGPREWVRAVRYADAVVLIGGEGATYQSYLFAVQEQRPVFPLGGTGGDASRVYDDLITDGKDWSIAGVAHEAVRDVLGSNITSPEVAGAIAEKLTGLLRSHFDEVAPAAQDVDRRSVFISYSHADREWLDRLRKMLKPLERNGKVKVWADTDIEAGKRWHLEIQEALNTARIAVFLVSPELLASDYINVEEVPKLFRRAESGQVQIYWLYIKHCLFKHTKFAEIQAAHRFETPLESLPASNQNEILVQVCERIADAVNK